MIATRFNSAAVVYAAAACLRAAELLPGTTPFEFPLDIVAEQYRELRSFYEREHQLAAADRERFARLPIPEQRRRFAQAIGLRDEPMPPAPQRTALGETAHYSASLLSWPILRLGAAGPTRGSNSTLVRVSGILLEPKGTGRRPGVVLVPDATESAADTAGLTGRAASSQQAAAKMARAGFVVFTPFLTQRRAFSQPWLEDRMWLMRLGYQTARHIVGADLLQVRSATDFLASLPAVDATQLAIAGHGQGGMTTLFAAALDERVKVSYTSGYLDDARPNWEQPEDRMIWRLARMLTSQDIPRLISPRTLITGSTFDESAVEKLRNALPPRQVPEGKPGTAPPAMDLEAVSGIANAQFSQWQAFFRNAALEAADTLQTHWKPDYGSVAAYERSLTEKREAYWDMVGRYPGPPAALEARSVRVYDEPGFTGWRLSVRVYDGVRAYGILLVPKGLKAGEKRPLVFVQHGLAGRPEASLGVIPNERDDAVYSRFGLRLLERGYIVFAPMIATQDNVERTKLLRRSHPVGMIPAGMDVKKFGRVLDYLSGLPYVDSKRFAFYGLSYGGYTALWIGPGEPRFQAVICSGHFNDWNAKTTDLTQGTAYPFYFNVIDQYNFGMLDKFNHSDLASLIAPRAFMVEMGDLDSVIVAPRTLVDREIELVLETYRRLRIPDRGQVSRFPGPHKIDGRDAYPFLDRMLGWKPQSGAASQ